VLVIDDYHVSEDAGTAAAMALFLRHLPDRVRMVIVSRHVPVLPLDRMRVGGELCEIDVDDLLFSRADSHHLVTTLTPDIDPVAAHSIVEMSNGWAAALQLCSIAWRSDHRHADLSDLSTKHLDGYVMREVLGAETDVLRDFVRDVAVVERFTIGLAEAITGRPDAGELIEQARVRGLFVSPVGLLGHYEVHSAVRHAVLTVHERRDPARLRACGERAAAWLESHGDAATAVEQWLRVGDCRRALRLLADRHVELYDDGHEDEVERLLAQLTPETTHADLSSLIDVAWCQFTTDLPAFRETLDFATWLLEHGNDADSVGARRVSALSSIAQLTAGEWQLAERDARASLHGYDGWLDDFVIRTSWNNIARSIALSERWDDAADDVRQINVVLHRDVHRTLAFDATRALGMALAGCPVDALRIAGGIRASLALASQSMSQTELELAEVIAHRELGDGSDAELGLERLLTADVGPMTYVHGLAAVELTQLHLDHGALSEAVRSFSQLERVVTDEVNGQGGRTWLGRVGTLLAVELGDRDQAQRWAESVDDPFWGPVSRARAAAMSGADGVEHHLDAAVARSPRQSVVLAMLRAGTTHDREAATRWAESAVRIASNKSMLQTLASAGELELIERLAWQLPEDWMDRLRRATAVVVPSVNAKASLAEPLTIRERDVLRFLPSRLTLREIAGELYVSVNTLKFHLKVIYRKLGVNSRAEAAEIARSWGRVEQR
jgi:LuxR family maltose regulon positive regulatory protein